MAEEKKFPLMDLVGMCNLLEALVAEDVITCEERDRIILRIAEKHCFLDIHFPLLPAMVEAKGK